MQQSNDHARIIAFSIITATLSVLLGGYAFGIGDHIEQLPAVFRAADNNYLLADFFTNASSTLGPRYFVSNFLGAVSHYIQPEIIYFILTLVVKFSIALVTILFVREISNGSILAGMISVAFIFVVGGFNLGDASELRFTYLTPSFMALPFIMGSLLMALRGSLLNSMFLSGLASLIHPTLGLETGALVLATQLIIQILFTDRHHGIRHALRQRDWFWAIVIYSAFVVLWWIVFQANVKLPDITFIEIIAHLRHPHHYLPSQFPTTDYIFTLLFILTVGISWFFWRRNQIIPRRTNAFVITFFCLIVVACIMGFIFVEIIPTRLFTSAQVFRLLLVVKWLGFGIIAANVGLSISKDHETLAEEDGYLLLVGAISPILMFILHLIVLIRSFWLRRTSRLFHHLSSTGPLFIISILVGALFISTGFSGLDTRSITVFLLLVLTFFLMVIWVSESNRGVVISLSLTFGFISLLYISPLVLPAYYDNYVRGLRPELRMKSRFDGELALVGDYIRNNLSENAILITPPSKGEIRLIADRAIVVDFKAFPFTDQGMLEWRDRLFDLYGSTDSGGFQAEWELDQLYSQVSDTKLLMNAEKYGACYAILYSNTKTQFQVLYSTSSYTLVELPGCTTFH